MDWFSKTLMKYLNNQQSAQGICLQICDVFIPELGQSDKDDISMDQIASLLKPFMSTLALSSL